VARLKIRIHFRDDQPPPEVMLGGFAQIATKRKFGLDAIQSNDPEVLLFGVFVELEGPRAAKDEDAFDTWLVNVDHWEAVGGDDDDDDPTDAATPSTPSLESPPTSE
jgi:hypothetical protein